MQPRHRTHHGGHRCRALDRRLQSLKIHGIECSTNTPVSSWRDTQQHESEQGAAPSRVVLQKRCSARARGRKPLSFPFLLKCPSPTGLSGVTMQQVSSCAVYAGKSTYPLSYRQVADMVNERGMEVNHTTIFRWLQRYGSEIDRRSLSLLAPDK